MTIQRSFRSTGERHRGPYGYFSTTGEIGYVSWQELGIVCGAGSCAIYCRCRSCPYISRTPRGVSENTAPLFNIEWDITCRSLALLNRWNCPLITVAWSSSIPYRQAAVFAILAQSSHGDHNASRHVGQYHARSESM